MNHEIPDIKSYSETEWAKFGKSIYDSAMKCFADKPCKSVVIPFPNADGAICEVEVNHPPVIVYHDVVTRDFRHFYLTSDGCYRESGTGAVYTDPFGRLEKGVSVED